MFLMQQARKQGEQSAGVCSSHRLETHWPAGSVVGMLQTERIAMFTTDSDLAALKDCWHLASRFQLRKQILLAREFNVPGPCARRSI